MITQSNKVAEIFADHYSKISRDPHIKSNPRKYIRRKKQEDQPYNKPFTLRELKSAIKQQNNIPPGRHYTSSDDKKNLNRKH